MDDGGDPAPVGGGGAEPDWLAFFHGGFGLGWICCRVGLVVDVGVCCVSCGGKLNVSQEKWNNVPYSHAHVLVSEHRICREAIVPSRWK